MKICLDAGHYGKYNQSPCNKAYYESDMNWKLHLLLKKYLEEYGAEVVTTRAEQKTDRVLYDRGTASAGCDLFLSVHSNAVGSGINESVDYPVAFCTLDGRADGIGSRLAACVMEVMGTQQESRINHRQGTRGEYYGVLRGAAAVGTPGLILEHSFHTNSRSTAWLMDDGNLDRMAQKEADVIAAYYGLFKKEEEKQPETVVRRPGWNRDEKGWWYCYEDGSYPRGDWAWLYEETGGTSGWYLFDPNGYMLTGYQKGPDGKYYFLCPEAGIHEGKCMATDGRGALMVAEYDWNTGRYLI